MTLVLKALNQPDIQGQRLWMTEVVGEYVVTTNEGGHGIAGSPNPDLANSAIVAIAIRNDSTGPQMLVPVTSAAKYNPGAGNADQTEFEFFYINDGWHSLYLMRLPVSSDGDTDLDGADVDEGDYYYHSVNLGVYQKVSGAPMLVVDYSVMIDVSNIIQTKCEDFFQSGLSGNRAEKAIALQGLRKTNCSEDPKFQELRGLTEDIISNDYTFRSGLTTEAQNQVEMNLDEFNVDPAN